MADIQVANTDADLSGNTVVTEENAYTITGLHTFSRSTNASSSAIWSWKNCTLIPGGNWDQSAICWATAC